MINDGKMEAERNNKGKRKEETIMKRNRDFLFAISWGEDVRLIIHTHRP
jgi:hypothetical protein